MTAQQQDVRDRRAGAKTRNRTRKLIQTPPNRRICFACKRLLDIVIAGSLLIALAPLMLLIAVLIKLDSPGPVIFRQNRVGARRRTNCRREFWEIETFTFYKFRSMRQDADSEPHRAFVKALISDDEERMAALQRKCREADPEYDGAFTSAFSRRRGNCSLSGADDQRQAHKLIHDPRVTRLGRILRKSSLDELPQLWNVLRGEMSLVGPRPPIPYEVEEYEPWHRQRLQAKPGLTGLWQVGPRSAADFSEMVRLDIQYIEQQSLWLDVKILVKTPLAVLRGKGAV